MSNPCKNTLLTGAAERLGTKLWCGLAPLAESLALADRVACEPLAPNERGLAFDLADEGATMAATGCGVSELIVYGGFRTLDLIEVGFERILTGLPFPKRAVI